MRTMRRFIIAQRVTQTFLESTRQCGRTLSQLLDVVERCVYSACLHSVFDLPYYMQYLKVSAKFSVRSRLFQTVRAAASKLHQRYPDMGPPWLHVCPSCVLNPGFPILQPRKKNRCNRPARAVQLTGTRGTLADSADSIRI
jgi:hypothetical protein